MQYAKHLLMIQPVNFQFNAETAVNNSFQVKSSEIDIQEKAKLEFDQFILILRANAIDITLVKDTPFPNTPDSIFPNNWVSFHSDGTVCLYPMFAVNRRMERKQTVLAAIEEKFSIIQKKDFTHFETKNLFLEGTGSMVLDHDHKVAYACLSPRTHLKVFNNFCTQMGYNPVSFRAMDDGHQPIYHTNVMMCVADNYAVICLSAITNPTERAAVIDFLKKSNKTIIDLEFDQMNHFAGNMLQVQNQAGKKFLVMSTQAFDALNPNQLKILENFNPIIHSNLTTIETNGGGSARCMMAEVFLPLK